MTSLYEEKSPLLPPSSDPLFAQNKCDSIISQESTHKNLLQTSIETSQTSMEDHNKLKKSSGDKFSFPVMSAQEEKEFEFGSWGAPADQLFFNGRLLPHAFPSQPANTSHGGFTYSRSTSRTSSDSSSSSSRDYSLMSSRSNSTNSRNSSCSSARTSTSSEASSERRILLNHQAKVSSKFTQVSKERYQAKINKPSLMTPQYGSSRRLQFITPLPLLNHQGSRSKKSRKVEKVISISEMAAPKDRTSTSSKATWFGQRVFRSFVSGCIECHAMKTSSD